MGTIAINLTTGERMRPGGRKLVQLQADPATWAICEDLPGVPERHQKLEALAVPPPGITHRLVEMTTAEKAQADIAHAPAIRAKREALIREAYGSELARVFGASDGLALIVLVASGRATADETAALGALGDAFREIIDQRAADLRR